MDIVVKAVDWLYAHAVEIMAILGGLHAIAKITPWEADNKIVDFLLKLFKRIGLQPAPKE